MTTATTQTASAASTLRTVGLDIVYGDRPADCCSNCDRLLPALPVARLELELPNGDVLCTVCADKAHHGLRLVLAVFNHVLEAEAAGDTKAATETMQGIVSALELTTSRTLTPPAPNREARRRTAKNQGRRHR